eukprot:g3796.t1
MSEGNQAARALDLSVVRYSRVWEDHALLIEGLRVTPDTGVVLSIASSGDNVLNLLLAGAQKVIAFDMSPAQIAFCRLKFAAVRALTGHSDFVWFLGMVEQRAGKSLESSAHSREGCDSRVQVYRDVIRPVLIAADDGKSSGGDAAAAYWDEREELISAGIAKCGRLEQYFKQYRDSGARPPQNVVDKIRQAGSLEARTAAFDAAFPKGGKAELAFKDFFGRENQAKHGRSDAQLRYVGADGGVERGGGGAHKRSSSGCARRRRAGGIGNASIADWLFSQFRDEALRPRSDCRGGNPYLDLLFYTEEVDNLDADGAVPYLRPGNYEKLRELLNTGNGDKRVELRTTTLEVLCDELPQGSINCFNLSDIFEYMDQAATDRVFRQLHRVGAPGALVAYWNLYLDRQPSAALSPGMWIPVLDADALYPGRHFAYSAFRVDLRKDLGGTHSQ